MKVIKIVKIKEEKEGLPWYTDNLLEVVDESEVNSAGEILYTVNVVSGTNVPLVPNKFKKHKNGKGLILPKFVRDLTNEELQQYREDKLKGIME